MIVLTIGTFDLMHVGHLELLRACRLLARWDGRVIVAVNPDDFVLRYKGHPPKQSLAQRIEMLRACRHVDAVVVNTGGESCREVIDVVRPDVLAIGDDWLPESRYFEQIGVTPEWMAERGLYVEYIPRTTGVSSTALRASVA